MNEILNLKDPNQERHYIDDLKRDKKPLNKKCQVTAFLVPSKSVLSHPISCEGWVTNLKKLGLEVRKMWPGKCQPKGTAGMPVTFNSDKELGLPSTR